MSHPSTLPKEVEASVLRIDEVANAYDGYVVGTEFYRETGLKRTADGRTVLIPQPSDSQDDPLNWSDTKKAMILGIIAYIAFLPDFTAGVSIITVIPQSMSVARDLRSLTSTDETLDCGSSQSTRFKLRSSGIFFQLGSADQLSSSSRPTSDVCLFS